MAARPRAPAVRVRPFARPGPQPGGASVGRRGAHGRGKRGCRQRLDIPQPGACRPRLRTPSGRRRASGVLLSSSPVAPSPGQSCANKRLPGERIGVGSAWTRSPGGAGGALQTRPGDCACAVGAAAWGARAGPCTCRPRNVAIAEAGWHGPIPPLCALRFAYGRECGRVPPHRSHVLGAQWPPMDPCGDP